jgi:hypothetical protein
MATSMIDIGALVDLVIAQLEGNVAGDPAVTDPTKAPPVGDNLAPATGGWASGQPGAGVFVPYLVLVTGGSVPRALSQDTYIPAFGVGFSLRAHGGSRPQCDWMARVGRDGVVGLKGLKFGTPAWKIINVEWVALGPMLRNDATAPPSWSVSDTLTLVCDG